MVKCRISSNWRLLFLAFGLSLALGLAAYAQIEAGSISGIVQDPSGAVIPEATVIATNQATNIPATMHTGSVGLYRVDGLIPGFYSVKVEARGFKTVVHRDIQVTVGSITREDLTLEIGQERQTVTVEATAPLVNTEEGRLSTIVGSERIANLALNGRNVYDLIMLAPGAVNAKGVMFEQGIGKSINDSAVIVNGTRENFNGFVIDGVSNKDLSGGVVTQPNLDIVQEFQVNTLNMSAQYGNSAGSVTNLVTKAGSNQLHGTVYEFVRNDKFDATDFFTNQSHGKKNPLRFN